MRLPQEVIDRIVYFVACSSPRGSEDLLCLSLTCAYMFRLLATAVQDALRRDLGPWAGDRLVFKGDHAWSHPEYIATASEKIQWEANPRCNPIVNYFSIDKVGESKHSERHALPSEQFGVYGMLYRDVEKRLDAERASLKRFRRLGRLLTQCPSRIRDGNMSPVLRNLTTKEYVREEVLAQSDYAYSLGEIVMVYTIWTDGSKDVGRLGKKARWAGHRFDISVMADVSGDDWRDVSDEAVAKMALAATEEFKKKNGRRAHLYNVKS